MTGIPETISSIRASVKRMSRDPLWPGFDPCVIPNAIFDGENTWLANHLEPPSGYAPVGDRLFRLVGRDDAVVANTAAVIGGRMCAVVDRRSLPGAVAEQAAVLVHEAFHVFQRATYPEWGADEADLFVYPVDDIEVIRTARLEQIALRRAIESDGGEVRAPLAFAAIAFRRQRQQRLDSTSRRYEAASEVQEGLAYFIERTALARETGIFTVPEMPDADDVRRRCYWNGWAYAALLDRSAPGWTATLGDEREPELAAVLTRALPADTLPAELDERVLRETGAYAVAQATRARQRIEERIDAFAASPGWRVSITAHDTPLRLTGFDPMNLHQVGPGRHLHTRFLNAAGEGVSIAVMDAESVTTACGTNPLRDGVGAIEIAGLLDEPRMVNVDGGWSIAHPRIEARGTGNHHRVRIAHHNEISDTFG